MGVADNCLCWNICTAGTAAADDNAAAARYNSIKSPSVANAASSKMGSSLQGACIFAQWCVTTFVTTIQQENLVIRSWQLSYRENGVISSSLEHQFADLSAACCSAVLLVLVTSGQGGYCLHCKTRSSPILKQPTLITVLKGKKQCHPGWGQPQSSCSIQSPTESLKITIFNIPP